MISFGDKRIRTLILVMSVLAAIAFLIIRSHYRKENASVDPRIVPAREMYAKYNDLATRDDYEGIFFLLDSIEAIYGSYPHYQNSYEVGVLYNNRAAAYLTLALYRDSITVSSPYFSKVATDTLFAKARKTVGRSITIYESWLELYEALSQEQLDSLVNSDFQMGLESFTKEQVLTYKEVRKEEISQALYENKRRLSVSYTNLGIIARQAEEYEQALEYYAKALELWDRNLVAENNINRMLGRPLKKRNMIQKLFPPEKEQTQK